MLPIIAISLLFLANNGVDAATLLPRAVCEFIQVEPAQGCYQLAERCGITPAKFAGFNKDDLCTSLRIGQRVCCTAGDLPVVESNPDGTCKETTVKSGDNCDLLATECGISGPELHQFNNGTTTFCSSLHVGQRICCSTGWLAPEGSAPINGDCATHRVAPGDTCTDIASQYGLSAWTKLVEFNEGKTWGWSGCNSLFVDALICVSEGDSPLPSPVQGAQCGPTVPGTEKPTDGTNIGDLNPCPAGECCSQYGYCGTTAEFCGSA